MYKCKYCGKEFEKVSQIGGHTSMCKLNPNCKESIKTRRELLTQASINACKIKFNEKHGQLKEFKVNCKKCGKEFIVKEFENDFPTKEYYFCSRSCANSRNHTFETKQKISDGLHNSERYKNSVNKKLEKYDAIEIDGKIKYRKKKKYFTGSKELDEKYPEIGSHQSPKWFKKLIPFGFNYNTVYTENIIEEFLKVKNLLYIEYVENCLSPADIYVKYNCKEYINHSEVLLHIFRNWNFPIRGWSKATSNAFNQGKLQIATDSFGHEQWYKTWENKDVYLRSNLELNYAKYLDENKISYDVEGLRIKYFDTQKQYERCAIPDFYLINENTIVEIKSNYTLDIQNMKDKFKAYKDLGYNTKLILDNNEVNLYSL